MDMKSVTIDTGAGNPIQVSAPMLKMRDPTNPTVEYEVEVKQVRVGQGHQIVVLELKKD